MNAPMSSERWFPVGGRHGAGSGIGREYERDVLCGCNSAGEDGYGIGRCHGDDVSGHGFGCGNRNCGGHGFGCATVTGNLRKRRQ